MEKGTDPFYGSIDAAGYLVDIFDALTDPCGPRWGDAGKGAVGFFMTFADPTPGNLGSRAGRKARHEMTDGGGQKPSRNGETSEADGPVPKGTPDVTKPYKRPSGATTRAQRESVQGKPCVDCGATTPRQVADHKEPLVKEHYRTGTIDKTRMRDVDSVQPQCPTCSARQGAEMSRFSRQMKKEHGFE